MACNKPWVTKDKDGNFIQVPCGWCRQCRIDRREEWIMRIQSDVSKYDGLFLTLTYNDENVPESFQLKPDDLQRYWKRLRRSMDILDPLRTKFNLYSGSKKYPSIRYYAVGEYGDLGGEHDYYNTGFGRPHYHAIVIGLNPLRHAKLCSDAWQLGFVKCLPAEHGSIRYVLKYMDKQIVGSKAKEVYGDQVPPFCTMSNGIGRDYLLANQDTVYYDNYINFRGRRLPVPRYYKRLMGIKTNLDVNTPKMRRVLDYMHTNSCTYEKALNELGWNNEAELISRANLYGDEL